MPNFLPSDRKVIAHGVGLIKKDMPLVGGHFDSSKNSNAPIHPQLSTRRIAFISN